MKKSDFDKLLRQNIIDVTGKNDFGYFITDKVEPYHNYYNNKVFQTFLNEMKSSYPAAYRSYDTGKGSELECKNGRYGLTPPKMASVASSSRFCYLALRNGAHALGSNDIVEFECEQRITGISGNAPQLDAHIPDKNIFVEAKCHEIFDPHTVVLKDKYWHLIYGTDNAFGFSEIEKPATETFEIPLSIFGIEKTHSMFDIKQLLCHLLGIASQKQNTESATLLYLFFKPKANSVEKENEINTVFDALQDEIVKIFNSVPIQNFIHNKNIQLKALAEYAQIMEPLNANNILELT